MSGTTLILYHRGGCHLCDELERALEAYRGRWSFVLRKVDVESDPELNRRYGWDVPVLMAGDRELCRHRLDPEALARYFEGP